MASITFIFFILLCATLHISVSSSSGLAGKIVGGKETGDQGKRFMVSLQIYEKHFCCGFLASWRIAISTGFCVTYILKNGGSNLEHATVFYGSTYFDIQSKRHRADIHHVNPHPDYDPENCSKESSSDIGYVLVKQELDLYTFHLTTLQLTIENVSRAKRIYTYGWGSEQFENPEKKLSDITMSKSLKEIQVNIQDPLECEFALRRNMKYDEICITADITNETCGLGDAGSPMVRHKNIVYGIASVVNIQRKGHPIVFIRLAPYKTYITRLKEKYPCKQPDKVSHSDRRKRPKKESQKEAENECSKGLRNSNNKHEELPDLNETLGSEEEEGVSTFH